MANSIHKKKKKKKKTTTKIPKLGWGYNSVVEHLPSRFKVLSSITGTIKRHQNYTARKCIKHNLKKPIENEETELVLSLL
jgi:hypothetical protein